MPSRGLQIIFNKTSFVEYSGAEVLRCNYNKQKYTDYRTHKCSLTYHSPVIILSIFITTKELNEVTVNGMWIWLARRVKQGQSKICKILKMVLSP